MKRIALVAGLLLTAVALAGVLRPEGAAAVEAPDGVDTVTVGGTGVVTAVPDRAQISAGVESRAPTARAALAANATAMRKVLDALRASGGKELTTQTVSLSTAFDQNGKPDGFVASNIASAETSLTGAGALIDAAVAAGANIGQRPVALPLGRRGSLPAGARDRRRGRARARRDPREGGRPRARSRHRDLRGRRDGDPVRGEGVSRRCGLDPCRLRPAGDHGNRQRHLRAEVSPPRQTTLVLQQHKRCLR